MKDSRRTLRRIHRGTPALLGAGGVLISSGACWAGEEEELPPGSAEASPPPGGQEGRTGYGEFGLGLHFGGSGSRDRPVMTGGLSGWIAWRPGLAVGFEYQIVVHNHGADPIYDGRGELDHATFPSAFVEGRLAPGAVLSGFARLNVG